MFGLKKTFEAQCYAPVHEISVILANLSKRYEQNSFFWIFSVSNWVSDIYEHVLTHVIIFSHKFLQNGCDKVEGTHFP